MGVDESILEQVLTMGFDRNDSIKALGAAYNNPDRAIEYLLNGIPNHSNNNNNNNNNQPQSNQSTHNLPMPGLQQPNLQEQQQPQQQQSFQADDLQSLNENPMFQQIKQAIREQPQLLQTLLPQLAQANPQMFNMINQNPEAFMQLLEDDDGEGGEDDHHHLDEEEYIDVTPQEKEAIDRLVDLGFMKSMAVEAYFACDKNEEMAANYLFQDGMQQGMALEEEEDAWEDQNNNKDNKDQQGQQ